MGDGPVDGTDSTLTVLGAALKSFSVAQGLTTFNDAVAYAPAMDDSPITRQLTAAAVQMLTVNDLDNAGTTVIFAGNAGSYLYNQVDTTTGAVGKYNLYFISGQAAATDLPTKAGANANELFVS